MRRNNFGNNSGGSGPLMTDHLQDLELELELLKRKRQLIQQQQNEMLYRNPVENRLTYGHHVVQPFNRYNDQRGNFSSLYDEGPRNSRPMLPKRHAQPDWAGPPADRFGPPHNSFKRARPGPSSSNSFNQSPNPRPLLSQPKPLLNPSPLNRRQPPAFRNTPPKRPAPRPNQPAFKRNKPTPPNTPKAPIASGPQKPYYGRPKEMLFVSESRKPKPVLSDAVEPHPKVNGRLELALGNIVKYIKETRNEAAPLFKSPALARLMKKGIRERVRSAMLGKVVGTVPAIVKEYRKMFPPATDADILELAKIKTVQLNEKAELAFELFEEGDPELFFKKNLKKLLEIKLEEMFKKAEEKAEENTVSEAEILEHLPEIKKSHEDVKFNGRQSEEDAKDDAETSKEDAQEETEKENTEEVKEKEPTPVLPKNEEYEKWLSKLIERMLPRMLPKFKDYIIKFLDMDKMYSETKAAIITHSNNAALTLAMSKDNRQITAGPSKDDPILPKNLPYFVKVQSLPSMPKKKLMQEFLHPFNPKTIKRHKKNYNLLFVGFANKEDYDKILEANQSKIGSITLTIVSTHNTKPSLDNETQNKGTNGNDTKEEENKDDDSNNESDILTPQLDDQINDLLSSIRKADEETKENGSEESNETTEVQEVNESTEAQEVKESTETQEGNNTDDDDVQIVENRDNCTATSEVGKDSDIEAVKASDTVVTVEDDEVAPLKSEEVKEVKGTPAKGKAPATPSTIRTRRASRLAHNN